jgi:aminoglycoside phosphotransferase (APT) family kinase protein
VTPEQAARLALTAAPGAIVLRVDPLRGGTHRALFEVSLSGDERLVVRGYGPDTDAAAYEARVLRWLETRDVSAPRLRAEETAALAITRLRGEPVYMARDGTPWAEGLARMLARLHRVPLDGAAFLRDHRQSLAEYIAAGPPEEDRTHPDCARLWDALRHRYPRLTPTPPALMHGDYFTGNVLWWRGRVSGVIDWDDAGVAEPGNDVGNCRAELAMHPGGDAPDIFLRAYEREMRRPLADSPFWDLLGAQWLFPDPERYYEPLRDMGALGLSEQVMRDRLHGFIEAALVQA